LAKCSIMQAAFVKSFLAVLASRLYVSNLPFNSVFIQNVP